MTQIKIYIQLSIALYINITVRMPYLSINILSSVIYASIFLEFLQIALCALRLTYLYICIIIYVIIIIIIVLVVIIIIIAYDSISL